MIPHPPEELRRIYQARFAPNAEYRRAVWRILIQQCFGRYLRPDSVVLDLGCGYGEFINQVDCATRYAMDLNPEAEQRVAPGVECLLQDCSTTWPFEDGALDLVFTSNFFEHLPDKPALGRTLDEIRRCLKPGGRLIAMGPNIKFLPGAYWDFWDHYVPLTELSLQEALESRGFRIERCVPRFLPYTMASGPRYPLLLLKIYFWFPLLWRIAGKQFLVVAQTPRSNPQG
jgi:SAM-dependent methyltransferase